MLLFLAGKSVGQAVEAWSGDWGYSICFDVINGVQTNHYVVIERYSGSGGDVVIPSSINGIPVRTVGLGPGPNNFLPRQSPPTVPVSGNYTVTSVTIPQGVTRIEGTAFIDSYNLTNVVIPDSVTYIGRDAFWNCPALQSLTLPSRFMANYSSLGFNGQVAADNMIANLANTLATNATFINNLAQAILATSNNYGLATKTEVGGAVTMGVQQVLSAPSNYNLFTTQQVQSERNAGQTDVLNAPNSFGLYTTNQIQNLGLGGIMLNRNSNNQLVLNYQILQSSDLQNWSPYQQNELVLSNAPVDKIFLRVQAVEVAPLSNAPSSPTPGENGQPGQFEGGTNPGNGPAPEPLPDQDINGGGKNGGLLTP